MSVIYVLLCKLCPERSLSPILGSDSILRNTGMTRRRKNTDSW